MYDSRKIVICPTCGAENLAAHLTCALCRFPLNEFSARVFKEQLQSGEQPWLVGLAQRRQREQVLKLASLALIVVVVGLRARLWFPHLATMMALAAVVPLVRTWFVVRSRRKLRYRTSRPHRAVLFLSSLLVTWALLAVFAMTAGVALALGFMGSQLGSACAVFYFLLVAAPVLWYCGKWVRARWERDVYEWHNE